MTAIHLHPLTAEARRSPIKATASPRATSSATDKNPAYGEALRQLKRDDPNVEAIEHRQAKHLDNRIEADHGPIKRLCRATLGFKSMKTAYARSITSISHAAKVGIKRKVSGRIKTTEITRHYSRSS